MPRRRTPPAICAGFLLAALCVHGTLAWAQAASATKQSAIAPGMTEQQWRGEGLFIQRCSICHQLRKLKNIGSPPTVGPDLAGVFGKATAPERQQALRDVILEGSPGMPGFQFGLDATDIDDLIAYLKIKTQ